MSRTRTIVKWSAVAAGSVVLLLAIAVGALKIWLARSPWLGPELVARVERATGLAISFARLDARLGLYGPELVFRRAQVSVAGQPDAIITANSGRVGFDLWRSLRTGRLASGRVVLEGAKVYVYLTSAGVELRGQGAVAAGDGGARLRLREFPVGRLRIEDSTLWVQDLRRAARPWRVDRVRLDVDRDPSSLKLTARVRLPESLGARLDADAVLNGDLATPEALDWRADVALKSAALAGWAALAPQWPWLPAAGHGDLTVSAAGRGATLAHLEARLAFSDVVSAAADGDVPSRFATLAGSVRLDHVGDHFSVSGRDIVIDPGHDAWRGGEFDATADWHDGALTGTAMRSPLIRLEGFAPLATLLPPGTLREAAAALAPQGVLTQVDLRAARASERDPWHIDGGLHFTGLGCGPWRSIPGLTGLDGDVAARGASGRAQVRSDRLSLTLATALRDTIGADQVGATLDWWWRPDGWRFAADGVHARAPDAEASGRARLWLPADPEESPRLVLDFHIKGLDARAATKYLPGKVIPPRPMDWLDHAFLAGRVPEARLEYAGETRRFPFRDGGGIFRVRLHYEGIRLHYQDGFSDIENANGEAEFKNEGFSVHGTTARIAGLAVAEPVVAMSDYRETDLVAHARAEGDAADALAFLQSSPVGPKLGEFFMHVAGHGPITAQVMLDLPFRQFALKRIYVDGRLDGVRARIPGLADEFRDLTGPFSLHDRELEVPQITGTILDGAFRVLAHTVAGPSGQPGDRVLIAEASGRTSGARLQPLLGITRGDWLSGTAEWRAQARCPRLEWRPEPSARSADAPPDAVAVPADIEIRSLPVTLRVDSTLAGLESDLPEPLAKDSDETLALRADVTIDPGLAADAPRLPAAFRRRDVARPPDVLARLSLGTDSAALEWRRDDDWRLARGTLHFGTGTAQFRDGPGLWVDGRLEDFDLSAWMRLRLSGGSGRGMSDILRGGAVAVDRFGIFGFEFPDVTLTLEGRGDAWHAYVDGPSARGTIVVPWQMPGGEPLSLDMERLALGERATGDDSGGEQSDPTEIPPLAVRVKDLEIQKRRFGSFEAHLSRTAEGLQLDQATLKGTSFEGSAHGSWTLAGSGQATTLSVALDSTDLLDTLTDWGFARTLTGRGAHASAELHWAGGVDGDVLARLGGHVKVAVEKGEVITVDPGAGRVLGLLSVTALPRRLTLDFHDITDKGFAFDSIKGDFELRDGNAYTSNLVLKGPAAEIGIVGRTGLKAHDYDQTAKVTGHIGGPIAAAGALAAGPAVGAALLLFSTVFKEPLSGLTRGYYRITGGWDQPRVERIGSSQAKEAESAVATGEAR